MCLEVQIPIKIDEQMISPKLLWTQVNLGLRVIVLKRMVALTSSAVGSKSQFQIFASSLLQLMLITIISSKACLSCPVYALHLRRPHCQKPTFWHKASFPLLFLVCLLVASNSVTSLKKCFLAVLPCIQSNI